MILSEMIYAFKNDLDLEYFKHGVPKEAQLSFNKKQIKLMFSKVVSDLQKELSMVESSQTIISIADAATYALTRDFMKLNDVYFDVLPLKLKTPAWIENQAVSVGSPKYCAIRWNNSYPTLILYPTPKEAGKNIIVKSFNDMKLLSINDGIDSKSAGDDTLYLKIPTTYDSVIMIGMMMEIFPDKEIAYTKEKIRLKGIGLIGSGFGLEYNMSGIPYTVAGNDKDAAGSYNADSDAIPSILPDDPTY